MSVPVIILGAEGRMGRALQAICTHTPGMHIHGLVERPDHPLIGKTVGTGFLLHAHLDQVALSGAVVIDFTAPAATLAMLPLLPDLGLKAVVGTTGLGDKGDAIISEVSKKTAIVFSPNMSLGVNILFKLTELVAKILPPSYAIEIIEAHHQYKKDSPSGTALGIAQHAAQGRGWNLSEVACYGREGLIGERPEKQIGIHAVRGGDIVGDHTVLLAGPHERLELKHVAHSRESLAQGAATAALFLKGKSQGLFNMEAVLGLA